MMAQLDRRTYTAWTILSQFLGWDGSEPFLHLRHCTKMHLVAELRQDLLVELTREPLTRFGSLLLKEGKGS